MIQIIHYRSKCIGCNACVEAHRERWRMSRKDGKCTLVKGKEKKGIYQIEVDEDEFIPNLIAAKNCPVRIIRLEKVKQK